MAKRTSADMPDMIKKTVLMTGVASGIGFVAAREMRGCIDVRELDVSDLSSIEAIADAWTGPLDILANNAGVMDIPWSRTSDGLDRQIATNSLGPFLLTNPLLPKITDRIVWVTNQLHRIGHLHTDDLNWEFLPYKSMDACNDSKP